MQAFMASMKAKRMQQLPENMEEACKSVKSESMTLREAARVYNVPVETLRKRVVGTVSLDCKLGLLTVLTSEEEACLAEYHVAMDDMGFGLTQEGIMAMVFAIVEKTGRVVVLEEAGMKVLWLAKLYLLFAHPSLCHMPVQFVQTKR